MAERDILVTAMDDRDHGIRARLDASGTVDVARFAQIRLLWWRWTRYRPLAVGSWDVATQRVSLRMLDGSPALEELSWQATCVLRVALDRARRQILPQQVAAVRAALADAERRLVCAERLHGVDPSERSAAKEEKRCATA